jgi:predicted DNA-binding mobile mystery protein A
VRRNQRRQARQALDRRLGAIDSKALALPSAGWVRAIRDALGLSSRQLGARLGVAAMSVTDLEESERAGSAQLATLRRAADAMDCDLVYAFVPRVSLEDTVRRQALRVARRELARVDTTMRLEDQALPDEEAEARIAGFADSLIDDRALWDDRR